MKLKKIVFLQLVFYLAVLLIPHYSFAKFSAFEILRKADEARGNRSGIIWEVNVVSINKNKQRSIEFEIKARGFDILAESLAPPKDKGNKVLMISGNMWFYKPGLSKAVPISQRQKLIGMASYGDLAATNYAEDFSHTRLQDEVVDNELCYVFDLKAATKKATYDQIKYWISKKSLLGIKGEYYTVSGKKFKSAVMEYKNSIKAGNNIRPFISKIIIKDELTGSGKTVFVFKKAKLKNIPDYHFNVNLLKR